jgi:hypothetical protein
MHSRRRALYSTTVFGRRGCSRMHVVSWECGVVKLAVEYSLCERTPLWPFSRATQTDKALTAFFLLRRVVVFGLRGKGRGV